MTPQIGQNVISVKYLDAKWSEKTDVKSFLEYENPRFS